MFDEYEIEQAMPTRAQANSQLMKTADELRNVRQHRTWLLWSNLIFMLIAAGAIAYASYLKTLLN